MGFYWDASPFSDLVKLQYNSYAVRSVTHEQYVRLDALIVQHLHRLRYGA